MTTYPQEHLQDSVSLEPDGIVDLFYVVLTEGGQLYLKANDTVTWQGNTYEGTMIKIDGVSQSSGDEISRPRLTVANPDGMFSALVSQNLLENAIVTRYRVLRKDIDADINQYRLQTWKVTRVSSLTRIQITLELREQLDGQFFVVPARMFMPPEYPFVSLS